MTPVPETSDRERLEENGRLIDALRSALGGSGGITEAASEIDPPRPKRGRPAFHRDWSLDGSRRTARTCANHDFTIWGAMALFRHREANPEVLELTGLHVYSDGAECYDRQKWKPGILAELGRLLTRYSNGEEAAVAFAVELARMRPRLTSKQAIAWVRNKRLNRKKSGDVEGAFGAITRAVDEYMESNPDTPIEVIRQALGEALGLFSDDE